MLSYHFKKKFLIFLEMYVFTKIIFQTTYFLKKIIHILLKFEREKKHRVFDTRKVSNLTIAYFINEQKNKNV